MHIQFLYDVIVAIAKTAKWIAGTTIAVLLIMAAYNGFIQHEFNYADRLFGWVWITFIVFAFSWIVEVAIED